MTDRKKRLEEIKARKAKLLNQLNATPSQPEKKETAPTSNPNDAANPNSNYSTNKTASSESESHKRKVTNPLLFEDPSKNSVINQIAIKKRNAQMKTYNFQNQINGIYPDTKDKEVQYEIPKEFLPEKEEEDKQGGNQDPSKKGKENQPKRKSICQRKSVITKSPYELLMTEPEKITEEYIKSQIPSDEKKEKIMNDNKEKLERFFKNSQDLFDKSLFSNDIYDFFETYYDDDEEDMDLSKKNVVVFHHDYVTEQSKDRIVTSLDWSLTHPDMFLAGYSMPSGFNQQCGGLIHVFSLNSNKRLPEFTIDCQTTITNCIFHTTNNKLVLGGTFTGQLLLWDIKEKSFPIMKTPLSVGGASGQMHCHPIVSIGVCGNDGSTNILGNIGSYNNNIFSISSDGVMCMWSMANFSRPIYRIEFNKTDKDVIKGLNEIGIISTAYNSSISSSILVGSDDDNIYQLSTNDNEIKDKILSTYSGHMGPIFSLDIHPNPPVEKKKNEDKNKDNLNIDNDENKKSNYTDHSDLFISSSADWTSKLWSIKNPNVPLLTFDTNDDYIYSSKWHPINPSLFVTGDGTGKLEFWDLNKDIEVPIFKYELKTIVNKLGWSIDGKKLAVGDSTGKVSIFNAEKDVYTVKPEEYYKFDKVVDTLYENLNKDKEEKEEKEEKE